MKNWVRKKWFRALVRCAVVGAALLALVYASMNWWGAREKRKAIDEARAAGVPVTVAEMMADMPPPEQNYAQLPFLAKLEWECTQSERDWTLDSANGRYASMGDSVFHSAWSRGAWRKGINRQIDFSLLPKGNPYGQTAASFLEEYDRRHGEILAELREGLSRPYSQRPLVPENFEGTDWLDLSEAFGMMTRKVVDGLILRAEAAFATGDPAKAEESIMIGLRLAETVGSRGTMIASLVEWALFRPLKYSLKSGFEKQAWSEGELERIGKALLRMKPHRNLQKAMQQEILMLQVWEGWRDDRSRFYDYVGWHTENRRGKREWFFLAARFFPGGWFDLNGARVVRACTENPRIIDGSDPVISWWEEGERLRAVAQKGKKSDVSPVLGHGVMLRTCAYTMVEWRQSILACALELHRLRHGEYPDDLTGFPADVVLDPFHGTPFRYQRTDEGYLLYSIGPDGKDDGGQKGRGFPTESPDWVW